MKCCMKEQIKLERTKKMEELKELEEIQSMINFMESHHFISDTSSSSHSDSHRFLANFLLFLMEPCGKLSIQDKCNLISHHLFKISPSFIEKALAVRPGKEMGVFNESLSAKENTDELEGVPGLETNYGSEDMALIGLDAMQRANSTLEDFCRSYFMFHRMDVTRPESIFKYLPMLSFTESYIYQLDTLNEMMVTLTTNKATVQEGRSNDEACSTIAHRFGKSFTSDPFQPLKILLQCKGLLTERIKEELKCGEEYWALERKLCSASEEIEIFKEDVLRAIHLKSFDYRVLNLLLYQLRGEKINDLHMEFLSVSEFLVEISDDLFDYEEDVLENNFNVLRMFVRIYGASAAPSMLAKCITEAEEKYEKLSKALDSQLSSCYQKRCEEAIREGGKISGYSLGSWTIPALIVDEELYRSNFQDSS